MSKSAAYRSYHGYVGADFLRAFGERRRAHKEQFYQGLQIQRGYRILDLGCGPGTDTIPFAHLVGPTGYVIGLDQDEGMVAEANAQAEVEGVGGWVEHRSGDAHALPFDDGQFDICHAERVFLHLPDPEKAFAEVVRVTRSGGSIALLDMDGASFSTDSAETDIERRLANAWTTFHANGYAGRRLYGFFKRHKFEEVSVEILPLLFENVSVYRQIFRVQDIADKALNAGILTQDEVRRFEASVEAAEEIGAFFAYGIMIAVIGKKP